MTATLTPSAAGSCFTPEELAGFEADGYAVVRGLADPPLVHELRERSLRDLDCEVVPFELEADLQYPGAPKSREASGGSTIRRLLQAHTRGPRFTEWIQHPGVVGRLQQLLGPRIVCPLAHHNCIMTKAPRFSSETGWHQDIRYWSFEQPDLVSVWLALGTETPENGCLHVLPGTHRPLCPRGRLDEAMFLRADLPENRSLIASAVPVDLQAGDVLFFHARTFHAAGQNQTDQLKLSVVFTYRAESNRPLLGTRSASLPEMLIHSGEGT
jgi:phytanoyl-CoA hydroxylase